MEVGGSRPSRSDVHLSKEEEAEIEDETRQYFDSMAPNRHSKPQRSEYATAYVDNFSFTHASTPELDRFHLLENDHSQKLTYSGTEAKEEFVETEYYKDLTCVDKQHHQTGTGFIRMEESNGNGFCLASDPPVALHPSGKGNPATNDWIPTDVDPSALVSGKPNRSEN